MSATTAVARIYVALEDEGTPVWRAVDAIQMSDDTFRIQSAPPVGETWQFPQGTLVRCVRHLFGGGEREFVAVEVVPGATIDQST